jgi:hypothetical protein
MTMIGNPKRTAFKSNRIGHVHYMFEAFKRRHGRKPTMRELVEFAIAEVKDDRSRGIWRELLNGITNLDASRLRLGPMARKHGESA